MNQDDRLGPYQLLRRLGSGGMGVVHLAVDPNGRQVAVKVLRSEVTEDDVARRRLSREVETMRRVRSPHIAEVIDADVTGERPYIVTRYVPGRPLDEIVKQDGPLSPDAVLKVAGGVAAALAAVHAAGVIHRDLKPGNVLILDVQPVLIDFGIAQAVDATRLTQTGMFIGTPGYLAPEIIEGHEAGPEVDIHALGGTLLFAATGQPPFGKGTLEMIFYNITSGRANVDAAPALLQPLLRATLHRDPARRPAAAELVDWVARLSRQSGSSRIPDDIRTLPNFDQAASDHTPEPRTGAVAARPVPRTAPPSAAPHPSRPISQPGPSLSQPVRPWTSPPVPVPATCSDSGSDDSSLSTPVVAPRPTPADEFVSLLKDTTPPTPIPPEVQPPPPTEPGDPSPTVRVTSEDLRRAGLSTAGPFRPPAARSEADIPTRRVRPEELRQAMPQAFVDRSPDVEPTPHVRQLDPKPVMSTLRLPPPVPPTPLPEDVLMQRSKAYGVASALLLVILIALTVLAPVAVSLFALPAVVLLRAADIAQPQLSARRPAGAAAADVLRVLGHPAALAKSIAITVALVPYALVLGLPVTLLLAVLVRPGAPLSALSLGVAVALWTVCAGPGVDAPGRQMRRTLVSLVPSASTARVVAGGIGALAAAATAIAVLSVLNRGPHLWGPVEVDVLRVVDRLAELR